MRDYFTADPHYNHDGVMEMTHRPFASIAEMNEELLEQTNTLVSERDRLFILGDFGWHSEGSWLSRIKCRTVVLIIGNHDRGRSIRQFAEVADVYELKKGEKGDRQYMWLSHYPHIFWPRSHCGSYHIYGHIHDQREGFLDGLFPERRSMDVGVDTAYRLLGAYRPFSWDEIDQILGSRAGHDRIEYYQAFQKLRETMSPQEAYNIYRNPTILKE